MIPQVNLKIGLTSCIIVALAGNAASFVSPVARYHSMSLLSSVDEVDVFSGDESTPVSVDEDVEAVIEMESTEPENDTNTPLIRAELKAKLLQSVASTDRGQLASLSQKEDIADIVSELVELNPIDETTTSSHAKGTWELVYSNTQLFRSSPFFMAGRAVCKDGDEAEQYDWFCDMHRAALAISTIGKVRQVVSEEKLVSEFEVKVGSIPFLSDFTPFAYSGGWPVTIEGAIVSSASIEASPIPKAYSLFMDTVEIKGSNIPLLRTVLDNPNVALQSRKLGGLLEDTFPDQYTNPKPVFETVYLDEDGLRISKDQDGKLFVYSKLSESEELTNYDNVMADLGVAKLLEGFNDKVLKFYI